MVLGKDVVEIWLDGKEKDPITRLLPNGGGPYQAVINTKAQPIAPPVPPATTVDVTGKTQPEPPFCRLNEDPSGRNPYQRMTLTLSALARGRVAIITVAGEEKREMMQRVAAGEEVPASRVQAERIVWLVDEAAAP